MGGFVEENEQRNGGEESPNLLCLSAWIAAVTSRYLR